MVEPALPTVLSRSVYQQAHGPAHVGPKQMMKTLKPWWQSISVSYGGTLRVNMRHLPSP